MAAQGGSLHAFLRYAERLRAGGDSMSASAIGESEDVVRLMTTHKSKGLEFPVVFVIALGRKMSGQAMRARVLVDYKTDADAAGAIERHRPQLELYAQALAGITGLPVRERVLYLVRAGRAYQV